MSEWEGYSGYVRKLMTIHPMLFAFLLPFYSLARPSVTIDGDQARYLYKFAEKMSFEDERPTDRNRIDFLGGCFYTRKNGALSRQFCECPVGRITQPDDLLAVVQPYLKLRRFPDLDDRENGTQGYVLRIEYSCTRRPVIFWHEYTCHLRDHLHL